MTDVGVQEPRVSCGCSPDGPDAVLGAAWLVDAVQELSMARDLPMVQEIVRSAARRLVAADGATFILRDGDQCFYADEDAIAPLWKGRRFPSEVCVSGWVIRHRRPAAISDVLADERIPADLYEPTFVRGLVVVPIRVCDPLGAIGAYWAHRHEASSGQIELLRGLASATSATLERLRAFEDLESVVDSRTAQLRDANSALQTANEKLGEVNRELERFAVVASHDLKSPLAVVGGLLETLMARSVQPLAPRDVDLVERALTHTHGLADTVESLLSLARLRESTPDVRELVLDEAVREVAETVVAEFPDLPLVVEHGQLPVIHADPVLFRVLLQNLCVNAVKFRHPDRAPRIVVTAERRDGAVVVTVSDNGRGVQPDDAEAIFEVFGRTSEGERLDGAGIGLATCRRITTLHGGSIQARPRVDGTDFVVTLPDQGRPSVARASVHPDGQDGEDRGDRGDPGQ